MKNKNKFRMFVLTVLLVATILVISSNVYALGIAPARTLFKADESRRQDSIRILNNQHRNMKLAVYATGNNSDLIKLDKEMIDIDKDEYSKEVNFEVDITPDLEPGRTEIKIVIMELPSSFNARNNVDTDQGSVVATTSIASTVLIDVPYPGKYVQSRLSIDSGNKGEETTFAVSLFGKGNQDIKDAKATIIIKGPTNEEITRLETESATIPAGEDTKLVASWNADVSQGLYYADAIINYDGKQSSVSEVFMIGDKSLKVKDIIVDKFALGQIAQLDVIAQSVWNDKIEDAYADIQVLDKTGDLIESVKTATVDVPAYENAILTGYWDTQGMSIGEYDINVELNYEEKTSEKLFVAVINMDNIQISDTAAIAGKATEAEDGDSSLVGILIIAVIALIVINVIWLLYFKKFRKKK